MLWVGAIGKREKKKTSLSLSPPHPPSLTSDARRGQSRGSAPKNSLPRQSGAAGWRSRRRRGRGRRAGHRRRRLLRRGRRGRVGSARRGAPSFGAWDKVKRSVRRIAFFPLFSLALAPLFSLFQCRRNPLRHERLAPLCARGESARAEEGGERVERSVHRRERKKAPTTTMMPFSSRPEKKMKKNPPLLLSFCV